MDIGGIGNTTRAFAETLQSRDSLSQLGRSKVGGGIELLMGFLQGSLGQTSTKSTGQHNLAQEQLRQLQKISQHLGSQDQRIASFLQTVGTAAGGISTGQDFRNMYEGLPPFLKQMAQTAFNGSFLGGLTGGDPKSIGMSALRAATTSSKLLDPFGVGADLGEPLSPQRTAMAADLNKEVLSHFQDSTSGLPIMSRTQGMSFDHIGKLMGAMGEEGGMRMANLVEDVDPRTGAMNIQSENMDDLKRQLSDGMELFRNLADVFGSNDFNELMSQAKRVAGLDLSDSESIKRSLGTIRNARGIAQAVGMDERRALGMIAQTAEVTNTLGGFTDPRVGTALANRQFAETVVQGRANVQAERPFEDPSIFRKRDTVENLLRDGRLSDIAMITEAEGDPHGPAAKVVQLSVAMEKFSDTLNEDEARGGTVRKTIQAALDFRGPEGEKNRMLTEAVESFGDLTGISLTRRQLDIPLKEQIQTLSQRGIQDTAGSLADLVDVRVLDKETGRLANRYIPGVLGHNQALSRISQAEEDERLTGDEAERHRAAIEGLTDVVLDTGDIGQGAESVKKLLGLAEARQTDKAGREDATISFYTTDDTGARVRQRKKLRDMEVDEIDLAMEQELTEWGSFGDLDDAGQDEARNRTIDAVREFARTRKALGDQEIIQLGGVERLATMYETIFQDPQFASTSLRQNRNVARRAQVAAEQGGRIFAGDVAITNPLQKTIWGMLEGDEKSAFDAAFDQQRQLEGVEKTEINARALTLSADQRALFGKLTESQGDNANIFRGKRSFRDALDDFEERVLPAMETEIQTEQGRMKLTEVAGVTDEQVASFRALGVEARKLEREGEHKEASEVRARQAEVFQEISNVLGGEQGKKMFLLHKLAEEFGVAHRLVEKKQPELDREMAEKIEAAGGEDLLGRYREARILDKRVTTQQEIDETLENIATLEKDVDVGKDKLAKAKEIREGIAEDKRTLREAPPQTDRDRIEAEVDRLEELRANAETIYEESDKSKEAEIRRDSSLETLNKALAKQEAALGKTISEEDRSALRENIAEKEAEAKQLEDEGNKKAAVELRNERAKLENSKATAKALRAEQREILDAKIVRLEKQVEDEEDADTKQKLTRELETVRARRDRVSVYEDQAAIQKELTTNEKELEENRKAQQAITERTSFETDADRERALGLDESIRTGDEQLAKLEDELARAEQAQEVPDQEKIKTEIEKKKKVLEDALAAMDELIKKASEAPETEEVAADRGEAEKEVAKKKELLDKALADQKAAGEDHVRKVEEAERQRDAAAEELVKARDSDGEPAGVNKARESFEAAEKNFKSLKDAADADRDAKQSAVAVAAADLTAAQEEAARAETDSKAKQEESEAAQADLAAVESAAAANREDSERNLRQAKERANEARRVNTEAVEARQGEIRTAEREVEAARDALAETTEDKAGKQQALQAAETRLVELQQRNADVRGREQALAAAEDEQRAAQQDLATMPEERLVGDWQGEAEQSLLQKLEDPEFQNVANSLRARGRSELEVENIISRLDFPGDPIDLERAVNQFEEDRADNLAVEERPISAARADAEDRLAEADENLRRLRDSAALDEVPEADMQAAEKIVTDAKADLDQLAQAETEAVANLEAAKTKLEGLKTAGVGGEELATAEQELADAQKIVDTLGAEGGDEVSSARQLVNETEEAAEKAAEIAKSKKDVVETADAALAAARTEADEAGQESDELRAARQLRDDAKRNLDELQESDADSDAVVAAQARLNEADTKLAEAQAAQADQKQEHETRITDALHEHKIAEGKVPLETEAARAREELNAARKAEADIESQLKTAEGADKTKLDEELKTAKQRVTEAREAVIETLSPDEKKKFEAAEQAKKTADADLADLRKQLTPQQERLATAQDEERRIKEELDTAQKAGDEKLVQDLETRLATARTEVDDARHEVERTEGEAPRDTSVIEAEIETKKQELAGLREDRADFNRPVTEAREQLEVARKELEDINQAIADLPEDSTDAPRLRGEQAAAKKRVVLAEKALEAAETNAARDPKKLADLQEREAKLTKEIEEGKNKLGQTKETSEDAIERWMETRTELDVDDIDENTREKLEAVRILREEQKTAGEGGHSLQLQAVEGKDQVKRLNEIRDFGRRQEVRSARTLKQMSKMWGLDEPGSVESAFEKEVGEFLETPGEKAKLKAKTLDEYREEIFTTPEAIAHLTGGTEASRSKMFTELDKQGVGRSELLAGLDVAKQSAEEELQKVRAGKAEGDSEVADKKKNEEDVLQRLRDISKARANVHEAFGSTEGGGIFGMMRDLMEKLDEFIGNRKPLDVRVINP